LRNKLNQPTGANASYLDKHNNLWIALPDEINICGPYQGQLKLKPFKSEKTHGKFLTSLSVSPDTLINIYTKSIEIKIPGKDYDTTLFYMHDSEFIKKFGRRRYKNYGSFEAAKRRYYRLSEKK
jgi:hypothetical protein